MLRDVHRELEMYEPYLEDSKQKKKLYDTSFQRQLSVFCIKMSIAKPVMLIGVCNGNRLLMGKTGSENTHD